MAMGLCVCRGRQRYRAARSGASVRNSAPVGAFSPPDVEVKCRPRWKRWQRERWVSGREQAIDGRIAAENIKLMAVPRPPQGAIERLIALGDATGIISDTMDELGMPSGVIGASVLKPTIP